VDLSVLQQLYRGDNTLGSHFSPCLPAGLTSLEFLDFSSLIGIFFFFFFLLWCPIYLLYHLSLDRNFLAVCFLFYGFLFAVQPVVSNTRICEKKKKHKKREEKKNKKRKIFSLHIFSLIYSSAKCHFS